MDKFKYWILVCLSIQTVLGNDLSDFAKIKKLYIETERRVMTNRSFYFNNPESVTNDLNLGLDIEFPKTIYYNNRVVSATDQNQFRFVGLEFEVGARPFKGVETYFKHFSGHALDDQFQQNFPQDNKIGIRWLFINK